MHKIGVAMPEKEERKKYCPSCGMNVPIYSMISAEGESDRCQFCNAELAEEVSAPSASPEVIELGRVYVVEDTALLREMISDTVVLQGLAREVMACENGGKFLTLITKDLMTGTRPGLVMLDVVMPILNGINAAVALRAVEAAFGGGKVPLLFFTVKACDEAFRKVMQYCSPAMYINKGNDAGPDQMQERILTVVGKLWREMRKGERK